MEEVGNGEQTAAGGKQKTQRPTVSHWCGLLAGAAPRDHIVQLYQDQQFLNRAVCRFAAAAIANGEGVILSSDDRALGTPFGLDWKARAWM